MQTEMANGYTNILGAQIAARSASSGGCWRGGKIFAGIAVVMLSLSLLALLLKRPVLPEVSVVRDSVVTTVAEEPLLYARGYGNPSSPHQREFKTDRTSFMDWR